MAVHFPIALLSSSLLFDLLARRWRIDEFRSAAWWTLLLGFAGAVVAVVTGSLAEEAVEHSGVPEQALETHEILGFVTLWMVAGLTGLRATERLGVIAERPTLRTALGLAAVMVLFVASYYGGDLVYEYAAGVARNR